MAEKIISKGSYPHPSIPNFVSAKQYMVIKQDGKRQLFLRFENPRGEAAESISFTVNRYNTLGELIGSTDVFSEKLKARAHSAFTVNSPVDMEDDAADFKVVIHSVRYGDYLYVTHNDEVETVYDKRVEKRSANDRIPYLEKLGGASHKESKKTLNAPGFFITLAVIIMVLFSAAIGGWLYYYTSTETVFKLDQVEYTFATEDREAGPINIIGYKGNASNLIIPKEIEGHTVASVARRSFSDSTVRTLSFEGTVDIENNAFDGCSTIESITIAGAGKISSRAFKNCTSLRSITVSSGLTELGEKAFYNCYLLQEVSLPDTLTKIGTSAFYGCENLRSITIPESVSVIGESILNKCTAVESLEVPFIGASEDEPYALSYFFGGYTPSTLKNLTVTNTSDVRNEMFINEYTLESVSFKKQITSIGALAFSGCYNLRSFDIPESCEFIGEAAFSSCQSLESITIPSKVKTLEPEIFKECYNLRSVTLHDSLESIGDRVFMGCSNLEELNVPVSALSLGRDFIYGCTGLKRLTLPFLGIDASWVMTLSEIIGSTYSSLEELAVLSGEALPAYAFSDFPYLRKVALPGELAVIGDFAFSNCPALCEITIPDSVSAIGSDAFSSCSALTSIVIPLGVTEIKPYTFSGCSSLEEVTLHNEIAVIGESAFYGCSSLRGANLQNAMTEIEVGVFSGCSSLTSLTLSNNILSIGNSAFYGCSALSGITLPTKLRRIGDEAFAECYALSEIDIPNTVTNIGSRAFSGCSSLTEAEIGSGVLYCDSSVFSGCAALESFTAPFPTKFDRFSNFAYYFSGSGSNDSVPASLKYVTVTGTEAIPDNAFYGCAGIAGIALPENLKTIGSFAFGDCSSLASLVIPDSVSSMGVGMLYGATSIEEITLPYAGFDSEASTESKSFKRFFENYGTTAISDKLRKIVLTKAQLIPDYAFDGMEALESIVIPTTVKTIGEYAFNGCRALERIDLPSELTSIGYGAFSNCYRLYEIVNSSSITNFYGTHISDYALRIYGEGENPEDYKVNSGDYTFLLANDSSWYLIDYDPSAAEHILPESFAYGGEVITSYIIPKNLFYRNRFITSLDIPAAVKSISTFSFAYCYSLESITFAEYGNLGNIDSYAFYSTSAKVLRFPASLAAISSSAFAECSYLESVTVREGLTEIGYGAFENCGMLYEVYNLSPLNITLESEDHGMIAKNAIIIHTNRYADPLHDVEVDGYVFKNSGFFWFLYRVADGNYNTSITLGNFTHGGVTISSYEILKGAFSGNYNIESVAIGNAVKRIRQGAFENCGNLKTVTISPLSSIKEIPDYAFYDCYSLTSISIPSGVERIGRFAFYSNSSLSDLSLPDSLTEIGVQAFSYCRSIKTITLPASLTEIGTEAFYECTHLYDVTNSSELSISAASSSYGWVGYYALAVHPASSPLEKKTVSSATATAEFAKHDGKWYLISVIPDANSSVVEIPALTESGAPRSYTVFGRAFQDLGYSFSYLVLPETIESIQPLAVNTLGLYSVYFKGSAEKFNSICNGSYYYGYVCYYSECIHEYGYWNYDINGNITVDHTVLDEVTVKEPTCLEVGEGKQVCPICKKEWGYEIPLAPHDYKDNKCVTCGKEVVIVTSENISTLDYIKNDSENPFSIDKNGLITSTNKEDSSSASFTVTATENLLLTFSCYTSCETTYDCLTIVKNGSIIYTLSGNTEPQSYEVYLDAGDTLTFTYTKDGSMSEGNDCAYIDELKISKE